MSSVTTGRIGKAWAFCFLSSLTAALVNDSPALSTTEPLFETRSWPAQVSSVSS